MLYPPLVVLSFPRRDRSGRIKVQWTDDTRTLQFPAQLHSLKQRLPAAIVDHFRQSVVDHIITIAGSGYGLCFSAR